jgi:hypothetical protein
MSFNIVLPSAAQQTRTQDKVLANITFSKDDKNAASQADATQYSTIWVNVAINAQSNRNTGEPEQQQRYYQHVQKCVHRSLMS